MKSKASFRNHPVHPILVAFPIAFFFGAFIFDVISFFGHNLTFFSTASYLVIAGLIGGGLSAVPGLIDYLWTVPPESSAKKRGLKHGLLNVTVVILFAVNLYIRLHESQTTFPVLALELVACVLLTIAGYLGGTLVYRNIIGVDMRYAEAGKWKEVTVKTEKGRVEVADADELQENQMKLIRLPHKRIVLARTNGDYVAFDDRCSHRGGSLAGGAMICGTVQCPWHGSHFDVRTGAVKAGPAKQGIVTYPVEVSDKKVFLILH